MKDVSRSLRVALHPFLDSLAFGAFVNFDDLSRAVITAIWANAMRHSQVLTIGTFDKLHGFQRIVSAAHAAAGFRVTSFWIRHLITPKKLLAIRY